MIIVWAFFLAVVAIAGLMIARGLKLMAANRSAIADQDIAAWSLDEEQRAALARQRAVPVFWFVAAVPVSIFGLVGLIVLAYSASR